MILWYSQSDDHPKINLAKILLLTRYESRKKPKAFYIFGYQVELTINNFGKLGSFFFPMKNPLYRSKSYFLGWSLVKIHQ
jgi:hypothetical protein